MKTQPKIQTLNPPVEQDEQLLNLDQSGWSIGEESFSSIIEILKNLNPQRLLEFGSGTSSIRLAREFPDCYILSVDHSDSFANKTRALKDIYAPGVALEVVVRPVSWQRHGWRWYLSYQPVRLSGEFDAVIIDGPPVGLSRRGREACLHQAVSHLREGGIVILDDYIRPEEKQIVDNWLATYPASFVWRVVNTNHHLCVLEKKVGRVTEKNASSVLIDNYKEVARLVPKRCRRMLGLLKRRVVSS